MLIKTKQASSFKIAINNLKQIITYLESHKLLLE